MTASTEWDPDTLPAGLQTVEDREALRIYQPDRVLVGICPACAALLVVHNDREVWPFLACRCGWRGSTTDLIRTLYVTGRPPTTEGPQ